MADPAFAPLVVDQNTALHFANTQLAGPLFELFESERYYLAPWLPWLQLPQTLDETKQMIWEQQLFNQGGQRMTTFIAHREQLVGMLGFVRFDKRHHLGELGYWLARKYQGKGLMTNCCKKLLQYSFQELQLNRVELRIPANNPRSLKLAQRLHFTGEGTLRQAFLQDGRYQDVEVFSLIKEEFNTKFLF